MTVGSRVEDSVVSGGNYGGCAVGGDRVAVGEKVSDFSFCYFILVFPFFWLIYP